MSLHRFCRGLLSAVLFSLGPLLGAAPSRAAEIPAPGGGCRLSTEAVARKAAWQRAALAGDGEAGRRYLAQIDEDATQLRLCRAAVWPRVQAVWLRLHPCDLQPGAIDALIDRLVALGYNRIHLEVFFEGQVLLPAADNPTVWPSVVRAQPSADLLAAAIASARARGVAVYAWLFSLNFGYSYTQLVARQAALARNGLGRTSLTAVGEIGSQTDMSTLELDRVFVDPFPGADGSGADTAGNCRGAFPRGCLGPSSHRSAAPRSADGRAASRFSVRRLGEPLCLRLAGTGTRARAAHLLRPLALDNGENVLDGHAGALPPAVVARGGAVVAQDEVLVRRNGERPEFGFGPGGTVLGCRLGRNKRFIQGPAAHARPVGGHLHQLARQCNHAANGGLVGFIGIFDDHQVEAARRPFLQSIEVLAYHLLGTDGGLHAAVGHLAQPYVGLQGAADQPQGETTQNKSLHASHQSVQAFPRAM
ncbi:gll3214 [Gloeobacter violaceus PCC 7421]|uniref:Gll3214 protein n=1 Tax=Gloeobacter violaceus (strain ATCC 29082 / PCC 7421) TaxID=251221 RepID=Q7NGF5_GLOVI|nr:gll3214 [Gloeobacter violaceus PCC 7421]